jgi:hypothetical protein
MDVILFYLLAFLTGMLFEYAWANGWLAKLFGKKLPPAPPKV